MVPAVTATDIRKYLLLLYCTISTDWLRCLFGWSQWWKWMNRVWHCLLLCSRFHRWNSFPYPVLEERRCYDLLHSRWSKRCIDRVHGPRFDLVAHENSLSSTNYVYWFCPHQARFTCHIEASLGALVMNRGTSSDSLWGRGCGVTLTCVAWLCFFISEGRESERESSTKTMKS